MKFICLGYIEEEWKNMNPAERGRKLSECIAYDDSLRKSGHFLGGELLQGPRTARTLRYENGKIVVIDGPYAETKEQIAGFLMLEAKDMDHAVQLMSKHPAVRLFGGPFEVRPAYEEIKAHFDARDQVE